MTVVDASILVTAVADDGADGIFIRDRLRGEDLAAPELIDLEVASVLRRLTLAGRLTTERAADALADLSDFAIKRASHRPLLARCWDLRTNMTIYDAAYVALAEGLGTVLLTADSRLARSAGARCPVELLERPRA